MVRRPPKRLLWRGNSFPRALFERGWLAAWWCQGAHSEQATTCPTAGGYEGSQASFPERELFHIDLYNSNPGLGVTPDGRAEHSELSDVPASAVAGRPILPASSLPLSVAELSAPQAAQLAQTQTITAPTVTERVSRKPSPNGPAGSSNDGNRKPDKGDKDGQKDDDEGMGRRQRSPKTSPSWHTWRQEGSQ